MVNIQTIDTSETIPENWAENLEEGLQVPETGLVIPENESEVVEATETELEVPVNRSENIPVDIAYMPTDPNKLDIPEIFRHLHK